MSRRSSTRERTPNARSGARSTPGACRFASSAVGRGLHRGRLAIRFFGGGLRGVFSLVRTAEGEDDGSKPQWLLLKGDDDAASLGSDIAAEATTSVSTGRSMETIAAEASRVWH